MKRTDTTTFTVSPITITVTKTAEGDPETFKQPCHCDEADVKIEGKSGIPGPGDVANVLRVLAGKLDEAAAAQKAAEDAPKAPPTDAAAAG